MTKYEVVKSPDGALDNLGTTSIMRQAADKYGLDVAGEVLDEAKVLARERLMPSWPKAATQEEVRHLVQKILAERDKAFVEILANR